MGEDFSNDLSSKSNLNATTPNGEPVNGGGDGSESELSAQNRLTSLIKVGIIPLRITIKTNS